MIDMNIPGQMNYAELDFLQTLARKVPSKGVVVELGSLYGRSSFTWGTSVDPSVSVYCIDPWERDGWIMDLVEKCIPSCPPFGHEAFRRFTRGIPTIMPIIGRSPDDVRNWTRAVDVYFDDSMHHNPYFRDNLYFWLAFMKPGGIMCGHDYCAKWPDVCDEVDLLAEKLGASVGVVNSVWWLELPQKLPVKFQFKKFMSKFGLA
ncbi:class I SAM-dependent methyltransferase [Hyphomicrobium facile]|uniref:Methyltransferase domain-containing protein n=1 Tax=Hyphomicrobium facile TaxID=51670 RepID=A0A1I7NEU6_9HYPH|nr:class I SAM-dependent methyltransferase [Hyphomicrobium facile]SFV33169.1 Methyltransferase domain-containing protein [Hyphomicrobium facile]